MEGIKDAFTPDNINIVNPILKTKSWHKITCQAQAGRGIELGFNPGFSYSRTCASNLEPKHSIS